MVSVRLLHEALIQVDKRVDPTRTHEVAVSWLSAIASYGDIAPTESDWLDEASILAERIPALLLPAIDAKLIELHLEALLEKLSVDHAADAAPNAKKQRVRSLVKKSVGILKQHIRQMQLLGTSLAVKKPSETMDRTSHSSTLIRIIDPLSKNLRSEINQFGACEAQLTKAGVEPWLCCRQVGLTFDEATRSFGRSDDQTIEGEVNALDRLRGALKLHAPMRLLPMNSAIMRQLAPEFFPVNVLLGGDGTVIGVTTGAESDKILSLLVQAGPTTPSQGISDVATDGAQNLSFSR